jgi:hypothetical protein
VQNARDLTAARMDVFQPVHDRYELILSFNLLQRFYFPADIRG